MKLHELEKARIQQQQSDRHFYFDDKGLIAYYGRIESDEYVQYNHAVLSFEQCKIIEESEKSPNDFMIIMDPNNEGVYTLVNKQIELESFKSVQKMLSQIKKVDTLSSNYDIKIEYEPKKAKQNFQITLHNRLRDNVIKSIDLENFSFKGVDRTNFYMTTKSDPHFMFESIQIDLVSLFKNKSLTFDVSQELLDCDIFTKKIFDKYEYKVIK